MTQRSFEGVPTVYSTTTYYSTVIFGYLVGGCRSVSIYFMKSGVAGFILGVFCCVSQTFFQDSLNKACAA